MNQQNLQQQLEAQKQGPKDQAAMMLAQAELMDTQTQARKQAFDEKYKVADLELKKERLDMDKVKEINRADEKRLDLTNSQANMVNTVGLDAMIQGLSQSFEAQQNELNREKELAIKKMDLEAKAKQKKNEKPRKE
jgi:hypothetical protein